MGNILSNPKYSELLPEEKDKVIEGLLEYLRLRVEKFESHHGGSTIYIRET